LPDRGTVILPDTGPDTTPGIVTPTNTARNGGATVAGNNSPSGSGNQETSRSKPLQGKIEIIVSPGPGAGSEKATGSRGSAADNGSSIDSRSALEIARDLHNRGQYAKAVNNYVKALDGAGDGAADIHQKIALCYYRLGDKDNAVAHYQTAIESF
jgi:tetratricopeptide (TPR) repeat protein